MPRAPAMPRAEARASGGGADADVKVNLSAVVLAGGRATRMGGKDKGLLRFQGKPLAARICAALAPQVAELLINANRNLPQYRQLGYPVVEDRLTGHQGPLAGMHAALLQAAHPWLLTLPCDGPFVCADYARRMYAVATQENVPLAVAHDGQRAQPVYSLIHRDLAESLAQFLHSGERKIDRWHAQHPFREVDFSDQPSLFTNINTPHQLAALERLQAPTVRA